MRRDLLGYGQILVVGGASKQRYRMVIRGKEGRENTLYIYLLGKEIFSS